MGRFPSHLRHAAFVCLFLQVRSKKAKRDEFPDPAFSKPPDLDLHGVAHPRDTQPRLHVYDSQPGACAQLLLPQISLSRQPNDPDQLPSPHISCSTARVAAGVSAQRSHGHACGATPRIKLSRPVPRPSYALLEPVFLSWPRCCTSVAARNGCRMRKMGQVGSAVVGRRLTCPQPVSEWLAGRTFVRFGQGVHCDRK